jgi:glycine/D-amino acid oxidase-like deaminating enzyme
MTLNSLSEAHSLGHDVLINATGFGSLTLNDVRDQNVELIRGQTMLVKSDYDKLFMRDTGDTYTYVIPRLDGTAILGGTRHKGSVYVLSFHRFIVDELTGLYSDPNPDWDLCQDVRTSIKCRAMLTSPDREQGQQEST